MKCPIPLPILTTPTGLRHVAAGEEGRGRTLARVPVGNDIAADAVALAFADVRPVGGRPTLVAEADPADRRALVYLRDRSGYRGSWALYCGALAPPAEGHDATERTEMIRRDHPTPKAAPAGQPPAWYAAGAGRVAVVAEGACAQGAAGAMGGGAEYILAMEPKAALTIIRRGRLYGAAARLVLTWDGATLTELSWDDYAAALAVAGPAGAAW